MHWDDYLFILGVGLIVGGLAMALTSLVVLA